jgi:hypothetical protein
MFYRFPEKVFIDTAKDLVGQLQRACLLAFEIYYVNLCHLFSLGLRSLAAAPSRFARAIPALAPRSP